VAELDAEPGGIGELERSIRCSNGCHQYLDLR